MRKSLIITIAAALLLAALICTAGCVSEDRIAGDWLSITDDAASVLHFEANETGVLAGFVKSETDDLVYDVSAETSFVWKKTGASEYQLTFPDEAAETVAADLAKGTLVFRGETYEKQLSGLSGTAWDEVWQTVETVDQAVDQALKQALEQALEQTVGQTVDQALKQAGVR